MGTSGLDFRNVDVQFTQGLDTKTQKKLVLPGKWDTLANVSLATDDTPRRRDGIAGLVTTANGNGLVAHNKELLVINGSTVSSVTTAATDAVVAKSGQLGYVPLTKDEVYRATALVDSLDCAYGNGFTCHVWRESTQPVIANGVKYSLVDETTGVKVFNEVQIATSTAVLSPRVVFSFDAFFIFWLDDTPQMQCVVVRVSGTPTQGPNTVLLSSASLTLANFDACSCDAYGLGSPLAMVAYVWGDGTTSVRNIGVTHVNGIPSISLGPTNSIPNATVAFATITAVCCALFGATRAGTFAMNTGANSVVGRAQDTAWANTAGPTNLDVTVAVRAGASHLTAVADVSGNLHLYYDQRARQGAASLEPVRTLTVDSSMTVTVAAATLLSSASFDINAARASGPNGPWIGGKAFRVGTSFYLPMYVQESYGTVGANTATNNQQSTFFLMDGVTGVVVAKALYGNFAPDNTIATGGSIPAGTSTPCSVATLSAGTFSIDVPERTRLSFASGINVSQAGVSRLKLVPNTAVPPLKAQLGESTYFSGGSITTYDGSNVVEQGFPLFPEGISVVAVGSGGSMVAGVHRVVAIYEWIDGGGNLHQSAPCVPVSVTTVANDSLTVIVPTLLISQKTGVRLVVFMTQTSGLSLLRVTPIFTPVLNVTNATTVTITVTASDTSIASNEPLYTQPLQAGSTLANVAPGPTNALGLHQNRVFVDKADDAGAFRYSQLLANNQGLRFSDDLGGNIDISAGAIVGFASMDEKLIIFCAKRPYVVYGSGPNGAGGFSSYGEPQAIPSDVGCSEARSILPMKYGIIFKSEKGWYLLGRDLQTRYIGEGVAAYDANSVSSAVLMADRQECRFSSLSGTQLIYSYEVNGGQWSTTVYRSDSGAAVSSYLIADAVWWATTSTYASVSTTLGLNLDTPGVFLDTPAASVPISIITTMRTGWLHPGVLAGFQRIRRLYLTGTSSNAPTSTLNIAVDYDDGYNAAAPGAYNFSVVLSTITFPAGMPIDLRAKLRRQKCKSVAFTFTDTPTVLNPAGVNFQALALELGLKRGLNKLPAAQSVG